MFFQIDWNGLPQVTPVDDPQHRDREPRPEREQGPGPAEIEPCRPDRNQAERQR